MNLQFLIISLVKIAVVLGVLFTSLAYIVWVERKVAGRMQNRWGPHRTGPFGLLQPLADLLKFIFKEDMTPAQVNRPIYFLAPFLSMSLALMSIAVIPFGEQLQVAGYRTWLQITDLNIGLLYIFAVTSLGVYGIALAGWSSGNKYSLLGGLRSSAQMISYELGLGFAVIGVLILSGTLSLRGIVDAQQGYWFGFIPKWNIWPQFVGFLVYLTAAFAETNRTPFDLPEAEGELVGGFHTEYSSLKFAMFFTAEYANMVTVACLATLLFFGGWHAPLPFVWMNYVPAAVLVGISLLIIRTSLHTYEMEEKQWYFAVPVLACVVGVLGLAFLHHGFAALAAPVFWFVAKVFAFLFLYIWVRWSVPRFRYDQVMRLGWKVLLPVAAANILVTALIVALHG
jgi:NADH-quinone oxidoreductase subunit H